MLVNLADVPEGELIDATLLLEEAGDALAELNTDRGHELLRLLRRPIDQEINRRYATTVQQ